MRPGRKRKRPAVGGGSGARYCGGNRHSTTTKAWRSLGEILLDLEPILFELVVRDTTADRRKAVPHDR